MSGRGYWVIRANDALLRQASNTQALSSTFQQTLGTSTSIRTSSVSSDSAVSGFSRNQDYLLIGSGIFVFVIIGLLALS